MIVIAIDPASAKDHAYSVWEDSKEIVVIEKEFDHDRLLEFGKFNSVVKFNALLGKYNYEEIRVLIEDQYMQNNFKTSKDLTFRSGMLAGICELNNIPYEKVNVATWTSRCGVYKELNASKEKLTPYRRKKEKARLLIASASRFGFVGDDDEASAVLIGHTMAIAHLD